MKTLPANMRRAAAKGFINATDCADSFDQEGCLSGEPTSSGCMVSDCISKDKTLEELTLDEFKGYSALFENASIYDAIDLTQVLRGPHQRPGPARPASKRNRLAALSSAHGRRQTHERKVFIDGSSGTTGLRTDRLATRPDIELLSIPAESHKGCERAGEGHPIPPTFAFPPACPMRPPKRSPASTPPDVRVLDTSTAFPAPTRPGTTASRS